LDEAIDADDVKRATAILKSNPSLVNQANEDGDVPLGFVNSVAMAQALINAGADVNAVNPETGETPVMCVSLPELVALFVKHGANLLMTNSDGITAEEIFTQDGDVDMAGAIRALLPKKAAAPTVTATIESLTEAIEEDDLAAVIAILNADPSLANVSNSDGDTPLALIADGKNSVEIAQELLRHGANVNATNPETGETPLFCISCPALVSLFAQHGANINARNSDNQTALEIFTDDENGAMVAAIKAVSRPKSSSPPPAWATLEALFVAVEEDESDDVTRILNANSALAALANADGDYPISLAASVDMAQLLLDHGASVNCVNAETGETPLFCISEPALVSLFASRGADLNAVNADGHTAMQVFQEDGNQDMIDAISACL
jgi:ankyrin repeat protein